LKKPMMKILYFEMFDGTKFGTVAHNCGQEDWGDKSFGELRFEVLAKANVIMRFSPSEGVYKSLKFRGVEKEAEAYAEKLTKERYKDSKSVTYRPYMSTGEANEKYAPMPETTFKPLHKNKKNIKELKLWNWLFWFTVCDEPIPFWKRRWADDVQGRDGVQRIVSHFQLKTILLEGQKPLYGLIVGPFHLAWGKING